MLLAIDIGNSLIKFGVFGGDQLLDKFSIPTKPNYRPDQLQLSRLKQPNIDAVVVGSVVPELFDIIGEASQTELKLTPRIIDHSTDFGLKINYNPPESLGIDRLINASAAAKKYGLPVIVCSFGTATVIDVITYDRVFLGGIIAPGIRTMAAALRENAAQLPAVEIEEPHSLIGNSTEAAILSGIVNGHVAMADGLIQRITSGLGTPNTNLKVVATGGFANLIASKMEAVTKIDENLTLDGLRLLA
jgi:type III pantothenate kinase